MRSDRPLWLVVAALGLAVLALAVRHEHFTIAGVNLDSIAALISGAVCWSWCSARFPLSFTTASARLSGRLSSGASLGSSFAGYKYRFELQAPVSGCSRFIPGIPMIAQASSGRAVEIVRAREGDFNIRAEINGRAFAMLVDTGASSVVLTADAAKAAGFRSKSKIRGADRNCKRTRPSCIRRAR